MTKVLWLTHPESDYGATFAFSGFCQVLGSENVLDYPVKPTYHGKDDNNYPRLWCNDGPGNTGRFEWLREGYPEHVDSWEHLSACIREGMFDLVVLESWRWTVQRSWDELKDDIRAGGAKVVLHDGEDFNNLMQDAVQAVRPDYYLKRELMKNLDFSNAGSPKVLPFPFSCPDQIVERYPLDRTIKQLYGITCLLGLSWQPRQGLADALRSAVSSSPYPSYIATSEDQDRSNPHHALMGFWDYIRTMHESRFGVSMRGFGWDSCRYWEAGAVTGLLADDVAIQIPHPYEHQKTALIYQSVDDAAAWAKRIASGEESAFFDQVRLAGMDHTRKFHTNSARVKWLLEQIL